jgi:antitoxin VapB
MIGNRRGASVSGFLEPVAHIEAIDRATLNRCLSAWGHRMGEFTRPSYAIEAHHALFHHGEPIAVTAASETVRETIGDTGISRFEVVELARLCAMRPHLSRPMLRLWRELLFPDIAAAHGRAFAVSYQDEALHTGDVYRHDGWLKIGKGGRGGPDSRTGRLGRSLAIWGWPRKIGDVVEQRRKEAA